VFEEIAMRNHAEVGFYLFVMEVSKNMSIQQLTRSVEALVLWRFLCSATNGTKRLAKYVMDLDFV